MAVDIRPVVEVDEAEDAEYTEGISDAMLSFLLFIIAATRNKTAKAQSRIGSTVNSQKSPGWICAMPT